MATSLRFFSRHDAPSSDSEPVVHPASQRHACCVELLKSASCLYAQMMEDTQSDFTMTFRQLSELSAQQLQQKNFDQVEPIKLTFFIISYLDFSSQPQRCVCS